MNTFSSKIRAFFGRKQFKYGTYAVVMTIVGIAIVILVNVGMSALENTYNLKIDTTQNKKYSLTEQTKKLAAGLTKDIYIYTTYPSSGGDKDVNEILQKMKGLSSRIHLENKDTMKEPAFAEPFTKNGQTLTAGDIIVTDADRKLFKVLDNYAQYSYSYDQQGNASVSQIKVEGSVTSAMNFINLGYMPMVYLVQGHGESTMTDLSEISAYMSDSNYNFQTINIAQDPGKVKPGDLVMFFNPTKDISDAERTALTPLLEKGGRFFFLLDPLTTDLEKMPNLAALLKQYDIGLKKGVIIEGDSAHYATPTYPNIIVPDLQSHAITDQVVNRNIPMYIYNSGALQLPASSPDTATTITSLLKTSDKAWLKVIDPKASNVSIEQSPTDETGPFDVAAAVEKKVGSNETDSVKIVIAYDTAFLTNPSFTSNTNNMSFFMYGVSWMRNAEKDIVVTPKVLSKAYFNVKSAAMFWTLAAISVLLVPILMIVAAVIVYTKRKHL